MAVLRSIESKLESLFEGVFGRAFRANVQPVELARKLVKEMDDHRNVSVSRVYVPNEYTVYLSTVDHEQFSSYEKQLCGELSDYLADHARREGYVLLTPPKVELETDDDLDMGVFGIATRMTQSPTEGRSGDPEPRASAGATMIYKPTGPAAVQQPTEAASPVELGLQREIGVLSWQGRRYELTGRQAVIGRSKDADVQVADPNVSRRHAEVRQEGATWWIVDLDSTNGVEVNGKRVKRLKLEDGARFTIGSTELTFALEFQDR
jgi:FhaA, N-terminal domain/FHA domain